RGGWCRSTQAVSADGYKEFRIPPAAAIAAGLRADALHGWPRRDLIAGAFPERDGSFAGTLHMALTGPVSFASIAERAETATLLAAECPDLAAAVPDLSDELVAQRANSLVTIRCAPWSAAGRVVLLGDAA